MKAITFRLFSMVSLLICLLFQHLTILDQRLTITKQSRAIGNQNHALDRSNAALEAADHALKQASVEMESCSKTLTLQSKVITQCAAQVRKQRIQLWDDMKRSDDWIVIEYDNSERRQLVKAP